MTTPPLTRLVVLWLLSESPHHGYSIRRILADSALSFWFAIEDASIYSMLRSLVRDGWAREVAVEREGNRPKRTRFEITKAGRRQYQELLRRAWVDVRGATDPVQLALAASGDLPDAEVGPLARRREQALAARLRELRSLQDSAPDTAMVDRERARVAGERNWIRRFIRRRPRHAR